MQIIIQRCVMTMQLAQILKVLTFALVMLDTTEMEQTAPVGTYFMVDYVA